MLAGLWRPHTGIGRIIEPVLVVDAFDEDVSTVHVVPSMPPAATISSANFDGSGHPKSHGLEHITLTAQGGDENQQSSP